MYPASVINLKTISPSLDYIKEEGGVLKIGALTRLEDIAKSSVVQGSWAALAEAAHKTASPHIRESGTIGGNICQLNRCWYFRRNDNRFYCVRKGGNICEGETVNPFTRHFRPSPISIQPTCGVWPGSAARVMN